MGIIKSYTDLEQSKKLAEILPLESADLHYKVSKIFNDSQIYIIPYSELGRFKNNEYEYCVPCWSLAVLLNILVSNTNQVRISGSSGYWVCEPLFADINKYSGFMDANNLVDACVEMIVRLKENGKI